MSDTSHERDALFLAIDLTRQFLTLSLGGIGFAVGLSFTANTPSTLWLWGILCVFSTSVIFGLFTIMRGIGQIHVDKSYNVYSAGLRVMVVSQILLVLLGVCLLFPLVGTKTKSNKEAIRVTSKDSNVEYPYTQNKFYKVEILEGKVTVTETKN